MVRIVEDLSLEQDFIVWYATILISALVVKQQRTGKKGI